MSEQPTGPATPSQPIEGAGWELLKARDFRLLFVGQSISQIGDSLIKVALLWFVYELTGSALKMAVIGLLETIPPLALGPLIGVYLDRMPKKRIMIAIDLTQGALILLIPVLYALNALTLERLYLLVLLIAILGCAFGPALASAVPLIVDRPRLAAANAFLQITTNIGVLAGPAIAGLGIAFIGAQNVLYLDAACNFSSAVFLMLIRMRETVMPAREAASQSVWQDLLAGFRFVFIQQRIISTLMIAAAFYSLAASGFIFMLPVYAKQLLHIGPIGLGAIWSALGAGMLAASAWLLWMKPRALASRLRVLSASMAVGGVAVWGLSLLQTPLLVAMTVAVVGVSTGLFMPVVWSLLQELTPETLRGRMFTTFNTGGTMSAMAGMAGFGWVADTLGARLCLVGVGLFLLGGGLCCHLFNRRRTATAASSPRPFQTSGVMDDVVREQDGCYILATSTIVDDRTHVLKQGETFAVFDRFGDIHPVEFGYQGLYHEGTRFLARTELTLNDARPLLLSSTITNDNLLFTVDLTNPDLCADGKISVPRDALHLFRSKFLWQGVCYERFRLVNYGLVPLPVKFACKLDADFTDIFEVRGMKRVRRGRRLAELIQDGTLLLGYEGLDGVTRRTRIACVPRPASVLPSQVVFETLLQPKERSEFFLTISCELGDGPPFPPLSYDQAFFEARHALDRAMVQDCHIRTSNEQLNAWLDRARPDLHMMITETLEGPYPYAGIPWFSTPFGRDGIITALEYLWVNPELAKGVLGFLAATQAGEEILDQDAEPGKILHETRKGEVPALGEVPFGRYYGSVDTTPLFVVLAGAYYERTGDRALIEAIWPNLDLALRWMDTYGDRDGDGFVEYVGRSPSGLTHQGWKDSRDAVFHANGSLASGPIALCEVQGYVYAARKNAAALAQALERTERANELLCQAATLQKRFEEAFWCEEISTYALALDGDKRACKVRTSNAGHCLWTGIAAPERARRVAETLMGNDFFSGWGVRTVGAGEARYNPMSYHNGSVWPHDNAIIAMGLARYGLKSEALRILAGLFDATLFLDLHRLPELFCGFTRRPGAGPSLYPIACAPQAWSAASVFLLLQACLGIEINGREGRITFSNPCLPESLREVRIRNLRVGDGSVDLLLKRNPQSVSINLLQKEGRAVLIVKQ